MSNVDCEILLGYLEGMINDGVQLVYGGQLVDWKDTKVPDLIRVMRNHQDKAKQQTYKPGAALINKLTGQRFSVTRDAGDIVHLISNENMTLVAKEELSSYFGKVQKLASK